LTETEYTGSPFLPPNIRITASGASRDSASGKYSYEGFLSPLVVQRFAQYMHEHRKQSDGNIREPDNWQKGMPRKWYMDALLRHTLSLWLHHRNFGNRIYDKGKETLEDSLCAIMFNAMGYLFEELKGEGPE